MKKLIYFLLFLNSSFILFSQQEYLENVAFINAGSIDFGPNDIEVMYSNSGVYTSLKKIVPKYDAITIDMAEDVTIDAVRINGEVILETWTTIPQTKTEAKISKKFNKFYRLDICERGKSKYIKRFIIENWADEDVSLLSIKYEELPYHIYCSEVIPCHRISLISISTIGENDFTYGKAIELAWCLFRYPPTVILKYPIQTSEHCPINDKITFSEYLLNPYRIKSGQFAVGVEISNGSPPHGKPPYGKPPCNKE